MSDAFHATLTLADSSASPPVLTGWLCFLTIDGQSRLRLLDKPPRPPLTLRQRAGVMAGVMRQNPGTVVRSGATAVGIAAMKAAVAAVTRISCSHARVTNEPLRDLTREYDRRVEALTARTLWRLPLADLRRLEHPGLETVFATCRQSAPFTLTFDSASDARAFVACAEACLRGRSADSAE